MDEGERETCELDLRDTKQSRVALPVCRKSFNHSTCITPHSITVRLHLTVFNEISDDIYGKLLINRTGYPASIMYKNKRLNRK